MPKQRSPFSIGRLIAMAKAAWDFYWYVVVQGALALDGWLKKRKRKKQVKKMKDRKRPK